MSTDPLARIIREGVGSASMYWEHVERAGVFDDRKANEVADRIKAEVRAHYAALLADERTVEAVAEELSEHDDLPGWTCDDDDRLVYECLCGDRSLALDQDYIGPDDAETAGAWHRDHVARAVLDALAGLIGGDE